MLETKLIKFLSEALKVSVTAQRPERLSGRAVVIERIGGTRRDRMETVTVAVQSYGDTLLQAAELNETVKEAVLDGFYSRSDVAGCRLTSDYNFSDPSTKQNRYQAIFEIDLYLSQEENQ